MWRRLSASVGAVTVIAASLTLDTATPRAVPARAATQLAVSTASLTTRTSASVRSQAAQATSALAATYYNSRCGNTSGRVLLTFDDWAYGDPYRATRIGAYLQSRSIRAAFFLINQYASKYPGIVSTLRQQGHWVLNHTWSHPNLQTLSDSSVAWQIRNGVASNRLRPPYGAYDARISRIAAGYGYRICTWTIDSRDWQTVNGIRRTVSSIRYIVRTSAWSAKASGVILGHLFTNYPDAVAGIIYDLHLQGLLFCRNRGPVGRDMPFPLACT
jgi:peptidoglycan/xylan/chitin deacetylase (PgdA/CDA1 family)